MKPASEQPVESFSGKNHGRVMPRVAAYLAFAAALAIAGGAWLACAPEASEETRAGSGAAAGFDEWTNSIGMTFVRIPAGQFLMGSDSELAYADEQIRTRVNFQTSFWMGKYEVTQGQWQAVMGENPSEFSNCGPDCPVESVSWSEVQEFVARLNASDEGARYRLPTEAEWEYAARGGVAADTPAGDLKISGEHDAPLLDAIAWYGGNSGVSYDGARDCSQWDERQKYSSLCGPNPVGQKAANAFGLHDMLGNVWEWVMDWYGEYPGGESTDPMGPASGSLRVLRGCGWNSDARGCRLSYRGWAGPDYRKSILGIRLRRAE